MCEQLEDRGKSKPIFITAASHSKMEMTENKTKKLDDGTCYFKYTIDDACFTCVCVGDVIVSGYETVVAVLFDFTIYFVFSFFG